MTMPLREYVDLYSELKELMRDACKEIAEDHEGRGHNSYHVDEEVTEVEDRARDGYIPFTNGGVFCMTYISPDGLDGQHGLPASLQACISKDMEYNFTDAMRNYLLDKGASGVITQEQAQEIFDTLTDEERESFWEYEDAQNGESEYGIRCGVSYYADKDDSLYFYVTVNTDAPYYRENGQFYRDTGAKAQVEWTIYENTIPLGDVLNMAKRTREAYLQETLSAMAHAFCV